MQGKREGGDLDSPTQGPFKADHLCYTKRSLILLMKKQTHNDQTKRIRGQNESGRGEKIRREEESGEGGAGPGRGPQGRLAMSLSGGGPTGLGLPSLAFPSNIMTSLRTADLFPSIMFTKSR